ncbi:uncharacterized protein LOC128396643 isoform X2 [Panonychus citri]|nr:uncharacterized protein LOC128396643 isoform X2 [Panonychus citri]
MTRQSSTLEFENFMYECDLQEPTTLKLQPRLNQQQQPPSISTVVRFDSHNVKLDDFKLPVYSDKFDGKLMVNCNNYDGRRGESPLLDPILLNINERITSSSSSSSTLGGSDLIKSVNSKSVMMMMMMGIRRQRRKEDDKVNCRSNYDGKYNSDNNNVTIVSSGSTINPEHKKVINNVGVVVGQDEQQSSDHLVNCWDHEVNSDGLINGNDLEWDDYQDNLIFTDETDSLIQDIEDLTAKALKETGLN